MNKELIINKLKYLSDNMSVSDSDDEFELLSQHLMEIVNHIDSNGEVEIEE